ncbi:hypothetical protein [Riemerella anatipestifer]|uniref:Peptidase S74 domain-containing protein n=1 Tax=Riemerella anatipestifer RA-CH-1 TaxID=1228997 RepID=J9QZT4_RIEAN|nr:hypothetical protein [Riemerella anatipestifer]AFR34959.1 hypothetical protein B739_0355 [Riemerella anatipestifer RA-CH-1]AIH01969.1 hypothetical protein M949_0799 [Riemerella anatipestifer CH3]MCO7332591.1 hypothetical protein [Riemerella anatipestifer]MCO7351494.1 hypothetical protein [Riemerella anatipestifer]MCO7355401.1 hypothetical protein [Riemerella anatipestifer]
MKTTATKLSVLAFLGLGLVAYGQDYSGKVGINYNKPNATLEIKGKSDNTDKTLEGLIIPNVSKNKAYLMTTNTEMPLKESTLIYVDNISDYTTSPVDTKVADITEKGYYFWNGTKWVQSAGSTFGNAGLEGKYNSSNQRIELVRSGVTPFTNKVYFDQKGGLKNQGVDTYEVYDGSMGTWVLQDSNDTYPLGASNFNRYSSNIEGRILSNGKKFLSLSGEMLIVDEPSFTPGLLASAQEVSLITKKDNATDYEFLIGSISSASHQGDGDAKYIVGSSAFADAYKGTSTGYLIASRASARNRIPNANQVVSFGAFTVIGANSQNVGLVNGVNSFVTYTEGANPTISNERGIVTRTTINSNSIVNINDISAFYYGGHSVQTGSTLNVTGKHYGLYLENVNKASAGNNFAIYTNAGTVRFGDKVGVGVDTPTEKLEVAGNVKATGFIGTNAAIFPDYVFQKYYTGTSSLKADYNFKTLSQVEDFVKTNGHLPGYKSAAEIKKQGYIDLMATQLTNVEKIEELYLHLLEKDKEVKELKERLEKLEKLLQK